MSVQVGTLPPHLMGKMIPELSEAIAMGHKGLILTLILILTLNLNLSPTLTLTLITMGHGGVIDQLHACGWSFSSKGPSQIS